MSTDRQKSFTARLSFGEYAVCFYELTINASNVTGYFRGVERTVHGVAGYANLKDTTYLCLNNKLKKNEGALLYFRYVDGGYIIYVREPGLRYGKAIGASDGWLVASDTPVPFKLVQVGNYNIELTLDDFLNTNGKEICIQGPRGVLQYYNFVATDNSFSYSYLVTYGGKTEIGFGFEIIETNVPYLSNPDEV